MVRGVCIDRAGSDRLLLKHALDRYLREVSSTKKPSTHSAEKHKAKALKAGLGDYSLAAITPDLIAKYRDERLEGGKSPGTLRLELSLLSLLFTIAIKEWRVVLFYNPVTNFRKPTPAKGRDRRLKGDEEGVLLKAWDQHSNPMLGWIARIDLYTGMRAGEIKTLTRRQVKLDKRTVHLSETKRQLGSNRATHPRCGGVRRPYEFRPAWRRTLKETRIKGLRFHDQRHATVSRLVEGGAR